MARAVLHAHQGGLVLAGAKELANTRPLGAASVPEQLVVTLDQYGGDILAPVVAAGEHVLQGQVIARPQEDRGTPLHAPVSGRILGLGMHPAIGTGGEVPSIMIDNDGREERDPTLAGIPDYTRLDPESLRRKIAEGGIVGLGGAAFPAHLKLAGGQVSELLLNGVECEPFISCDDALMRHRAGDIVLGAQVLLHVLQASHCTIAIEADKPAAIVAMRAALAAAADDRIETVTIPVFYPAGGERQLIATLYGKEVPAQGLPRDVGVVCQNVGTAAAIASLVRTGEPLISRIVTVTGHGARQPRNLEGRLGTALSHLVAECGGYADAVRLIAGGSMMGVALPHDRFTISKTTNCIIVATPVDLEVRGPEVPCIRCGDCASACPAGLLPQELYRYIRLENDAALSSLGLGDCIECGCCDYVCPSQIPLTITFAGARQRARDEARRNERSDLARLRFQAHNQRIESEQVGRQRKLKERRPDAGRDNS